MGNKRETVMMELDAKDIHLSFGKTCDCDIDGDADITLEDFVGVWNGKFITCNKCYEPFFLTSVVAEIDTIRRRKEASGGIVKSTTEDKIIVDLSKRID